MPYPSEWIAAAHRAASTKRAARIEIVPARPPDIQSARVETRAERPIAHMAAGTGAYTSLMAAHDRLRQRHISGARGT